MPEWLLSFCVHICLLFGATVSVLGFLAIAVVLAIEIWDFFHEEETELEDDDSYYRFDR